MVLEKHYVESVLNSMKKREIIIAALGIAFVFIVTSFIVFPLGSIGYINIGDSIILLFANIMPPGLSFLIGGIGSAMADFLLAPQYAIFTFVIKGLEGYIASKFIRKSNQFSMYIAGILVVIGYAITDIILTGQLYMALPSLAFNSLQIVICILIAKVGTPFIKKIYRQ